MLRFFHASGDLVANAMRVFVEDAPRPPVGVLESLGVSLGHDVANVLDYHSRLLSS
jgi:hypothetical protein